MSYILSGISFFIALAALMKSYKRRHVSHGNAIDVLFPKLRLNIRSLPYVMGVNEICGIYKDCLGDSFSDDPEGLCCSRSYTILVTTDYLGTYVWLDDEEKELILDYDEYSAVRDRVNEYVRKYMIREEEKKKTRGRPKKKFTTKTK